MTLLVCAQPNRAVACSPPFEQPTIEALGPSQVVVLGTLGERVAGGRLFHVERWYNGAGAATPILIAFQEGEPMGDCSYPVSTGERLIIAPQHGPDGSLSANLTTLQADPATDTGRAYLEEAATLFGPGIVPPPRPEPPAEEPPDVIAPPAPDMLPIALAVAVATLALFGSALVVARRHHRVR